MDLFDKELKKLVAKGKSQGYLTYDEVNHYLPDDEINPDKLDNLLIALEEQGIEVETFVRPMSEVDRAIADGEENGIVKVHVRKGSGKILGATIVADHAGEMISEITLAMVAGAPLGTLAGVIHPYPTQAEAIKHVADAYSRTRLTPRVAAAMKWLLKRRR